MPTGILVVSSGVSSINGTNLARQNEPNPLAAATNFIAESGFSPGDFIRVEGSDGAISTSPVFFITSVSAGAQDEVAAAAVGRRRRSRRKVRKPRAAKKPAKKAAKKSSKKTAKKSSKKSSKKTGKKTAKKKAAKKSTKKTARKSAKKR
jgi:hypothetical protein